MSPDEDVSKIKNRHRLDIVRDVLTVASVRIRKTKIMYRANLSFVQVEKYLKDLLAAGLVESAGASMYVTTKRGEEFLQSYSKYLERISRIELEREEAKRDKQKLEEDFLI